MRKIILLIVVVFATFCFSEANSESVPGNIQSYFPFLVDVGMHYNLLKPTQTGNTRYGYSVCTAKEIIDGELCGAINETMFLGTMKIKNISIYAIADNQVFLSYTKGLAGEHKYITRPIILKLPQNKKKKVEWSYHHDRDTSEIHKCTSEYMDSISTKLGVLKDIIVVTEQTFSEGELFLTEKRYYAKNYGLVRNESIGKSGEVLDNVSYELVKKE